MCFLSTGCSTFPYACVTRPILRQTHTYRNSIWGNLFRLSITFLDYINQHRERCSCLLLLLPTRWYCYRCINIYLDAACWLAKRYIHDERHGIQAAKAPKTYIHNCLDYTNCFPAASRPPSDFLPPEFKSWLSAKTSVTIARTLHRPPRLVDVQVLEEHNLSRRFGEGAIGLLKADCWRAADAESKTIGRKEKKKKKELFSWTSRYTCDGQQ